MGMRKDSRKWIKTELCWVSAFGNAMHHEKGRKDRRKRKPMRNCAMEMAEEGIELWRS